MSRRSKETDEARLSRIRHTLAGRTRWEGQIENYDEFLIRLLDAERTRAEEAEAKLATSEARVAELEGEVERLREAAEDVAEALEIAEHDGDGPETGLFAEFADALRAALTLARGELEEKNDAD